MGQQYSARASGVSQLHCEPTRTNEGSYYILVYTVSPCRLAGAKPILRLVGRLSVTSDRYGTHCTLNTLTVYTFTTTHEYHMIMADLCAELLIVT